MKLLKLERIGNGSPQGGTNPYCKRIKAVGRDGFIVTEFMKFNRDYTDANGVGTRGVYDYYILPPGIYEILEAVSWKKSRKYYLFIDDGYSEQEMNYEEAIECLSGGSVSMC